MNLPKTQWLSSSETECKRILYTAGRISSYFYQQNHFYVVPTFPKSTYSRDSVVIFPELPYTKHFWAEANKVVTKEEFIPSIKSTALLNRFIINNSAEHEVKKEWSRNEPYILTYIFQMIPDSAKKIQNITIHPTRYGTIASFTIPTKKKPYLELWLRQDATLDKIVEVIITAITRQQVFSLHGSWEESEMLADWFLHFSGLKQFFEPKKIQSTLSSIRQTPNLDLKTKSNDFLERIGFPPDKKSLQLVSGVFTVGTKQIQNLSPTEQEVLQLLYDKRSASYDDIAEVIFTNYDDFSLNTIVKIIQRLRKKITQNGIFHPIIHTKRGYGYTIVN